SIAAITSLYILGYTRHLSLPHALYYIYEAKIAAERASGVGQTSHIIILKPDKESFIGPADQDALRAVYEQMKSRDLSNDDLKKVLTVVQNAPELGRGSGG